MTALLDCLKALAARPAPLPEPLAFIAHPAWVEDESMLAVLRGMQASGIGVRVQTDIRLPSVSLDYWLDRRPAPEICGNCDTPLPGGCGGLFADDGALCRWKP